MFWRRISVLAGATAVSFALTAGLADASVGPPVYMLPGYQSGYQAQNSAGFQAYQATFTVPDAPADGQVSPGDVVTVTMHYAQTGRMRCKVTDINTGATATGYFTGPTGENWDEADIGAIPSTTSPANPLTLSSFSNVRLTPVGAAARRWSKVHGPSRRSSTRPTAPPPGRWSPVPP